MFWIVHVFDSISLCLLSVGAVSSFLIFLPVVVHASTCFCLCVVTLLGGSFIDLSNLCCCVACVVSAHMRVWLIWFASPCLVSFLH